MSFCHLHLHTHYSLLDGASRVPELIGHVKANGMEAVAITDHGTLSGVVELVREAKEGGVKPIVGIEAYVAPNSRRDRAEGGKGTGKKGSGDHSYHLTLLAKTGRGVKNLIKMSSLSYIEGYYYKPRIDKEILEQYSEGVVCLSGCVGGELADLLMRGDDAGAEGLAAWYARVFGDNFYVEVQDNATEIQTEYGAMAVGLADRMGLPLVATSDAHYLKRTDSVPHDILLCINTHKTFADRDRMKFESNQFHVRSPDEMYAAMPGMEEAIERAGAIADGVEDGYPSWEFGKRSFPSFPCPDGMTDEWYLRRLCERGAAERYGDARAEYTDRIEYELSVIFKMGFASYFLVVWDFVRFARENGILVTARGSACGSVVSYLLYISAFCPVKHGLLFERFLDPSRSDPPDIDIDIDRERRQEVVDYVTEKYGRECVAGIGTTMTLGPKTAMKDVAKVLGIDYATVSEATDLISMRLGTTLKGTYDSDPVFRKTVGANNRIKTVYEYALRLEGVAKSAGVHAAGVVIADRPLVDLVPVQVRPKDGFVSTQWTMGDLEKAGALKMDFLGSRNMYILSIISGLTGIRDFYELPLDDAATYETLGRGDTRGIFQLNEDGITDIVVRVGPTRFDDIVAILALYRPGPLGGGLVDTYVDVKHGRKKPDYVHPFMEEVLESTYSVMIYQEQIMKILNRLGGIELTRAYACIKAISKKKPELVARFRAEFVAGAKKNVNESIAIYIFDLIEFFSSYGFNQSHSCSYAMIAYQTAYFKTHHPEAFWAAVLTSEMDGAERGKYLAQHVRDCRRMGIKVLPPDINKSEYGFITQKGGGVRYGLGAVKEMDSGRARAVVAARGDGYKDIYDFVRRSGYPQAAEPLVRAGAFDALGPRGPMVAVIPGIVRGERKLGRERARGQTYLFDDDEPGAASLPAVPDLDDATKAADEKRLLDAYVSNNPIDKYTDVFSKVAAHAEAGRVVVCGVVTEYATKEIRSGTMLSLTIEDAAASHDAIVWPDRAARAKGVGVGWVGAFYGTAETTRGRRQVVVERCVPADLIESETTRGVVVTVPDGIAPDHMGALNRMIQVCIGPTQIYMSIGGKVYKAGPTYRVRYDRDFVEAVEEITGKGTVKPV